MIPLLSSSRAPDCYVMVLDAAFSTCSMLPEETSHRDPPVVRCPSWNPLLRTCATANLHTAVAFALKLQTSLDQVQHVHAETLGCSQHLTSSACTTPEKSATIQGRAHLCVQPCGSHALLHVVNTRSRKPGLLVTCNVYVLILHLVQDKGAILACSA